MSSILYYSNFCEPSKKLLQTVSKTGNSHNIHFVCIDKRVKEANGKVFPLSILNLKTYSLIQSFFSDLDRSLTVKKLRSL